MKAGIAGAGICGRLLALALSNAGWQVTLFDKNNSFEDDNCSMAAAGLLTPIAELEKAEHIIYELGKAAIDQHWPVIISQLNSQQPIYFQKTGSLLISSVQERKELQGVINLIKSKLSDKYHQKLNQQELLTLEPEINKFSEAYYFADEAHMDNQSLMNHVIHFLNSRHVQWQLGTSVDLSPGKIKLDSVEYKFDMVFDCRGLGAKKTFHDLRSVRGELIWLHAPEVNIKRPVRLLHPRYRLYVVPRPGNSYILGASEIEAEDFSPISVRSVLELLSAAYYLHSGFAEARIIKTVTQCRPTLTNHLPNIKFTDGLLAMNGLYRHGFLVAPTLIADIMDWLKHGYHSIKYPQLWEKL